jgi:hypothetical protein
MTGHFRLIDRPEAPELVERWIDEFGLSGKAVLTIAETAESALVVTWLPDGPSGR